MTHSISFCSAVASDWLVLRIKIIKASLGSLVYNKITKKRASNCLVPCYAKRFHVAEWPCHSHPWRSQERTVGSRKTAAKVFKNGRGMLLLTNQFHDSFECLSILEASIYRTAFVIFLYDGVTYKLFLSSFYACPSEGVSFGLRQ